MCKSFSYRTCAQDDCGEMSVLKSGHDVCLNHLKCIVNSSYDPNSCESCTKILDSIMSGDENYFRSTKEWRLHVSFISFKSTLTLPLKWVDEQLKKFFNMIFSMSRKLPIVCEVIYLFYFFSKLKLMHPG